MTEIDVTLDFIHESEHRAEVFKFLLREGQLMGSRFYGTAEANSDYDYMVLDLDANRLVLEELGFQRIQHEELGYTVDICSSGIWRIIIGDSQIDVQLIKNTFAWNVKLQTSQLIRDLNIFKDIDDKRIRAKIFINMLQSVWIQEEILNEKQRNH